MASEPEWGSTPALQVVSRFVDVEFDEGWLAQLQAVAELLSAQLGCVSVLVGRSLDDPGGWVLTSEWESVGQYRRALSSYEVKVQGVPVLARAVDEPSAFELLYSNRGGEVTQATSALDADSAG
jgi:quinol monooxygenase YgiN